MCKILINKIVVKTNDSLAGLLLIGLVLFLHPCWSKPRIAVNYAAFIPRNDDCISTLVHPDASLKQRLFTPAGIGRLQRLCAPVGTARLLLYDGLG